VAKKRRQGSSRKNSRKGQGFKIKFLTAKNVIVVAVIIIFSGSLFYFMKNVIYKNSFFAVKSIIVNKDQPYVFTEGVKKLESLYKDHNIFHIDLAKAERKIKKEYPQFKKVEVKRVLPDSLQVQIISREPIAYIDASGGMIIDDEGIVLLTNEALEGLVEIKGINFFLKRFSKGEKIHAKSLIDALTLLKILRYNIPGKMDLIRYVDVSDHKNILLEISGVEVKFGRDGFIDKVKQLKVVIADPDISLQDISYIDLRFEDVVIAPK